MNLEIEYSHPESVREDGDLYDITNTDDDLSAFTNSTSDKNINLSLNQSLYNNDSLKQIVNHKLTQSILYNSVDEPKLQNTENYIKLNYNNGSISNKVFLMSIFSYNLKSFIMMISMTNPVRFISCYSSKTRRSNIENSSGVFIKITITGSCTFSKSR